MSAPARSTTLISLVVAVAFFMQMLDGVIIITALPQMGETFGVAPLQMSIGLTAYMLATAVFVTLSGWLADRFGDRQIFLFAILVFTAASLWCGMVQSLEWFIVARMAQGLGGAMMLPVGRMIVLRNAERSELVRAIATITWPALVAPVIGPALGGFITETLSWRWNFFINVPVGLLGMVLVLGLVPRTGGGNRRPMDWLGFVLSSTSMAGLLLGLEMLVHMPGQLALAGGLVAVGVLLGILTIRHLRRAAHPLMDITVFRHQTFAVSNLWAGSYVRLAINAAPFLLPLMLQTVFGLDALQAGTLLAAYFLGNLGMKAITTALLRWFGFRNILLYNGLLCGVSLALLAYVNPALPDALLFVMLFFGGLTRSMQFTALATIAYADIGAEERSSASTIASMLVQLVQLLAVAISAGLLAVSAGVRGAAAPGLFDFQIVFFVMAALALVSMVMILRLPADAGREVSGHRLRSEPRS